MSHVTHDREREPGEYVVRGFEAQDRERFLSLYETVWGVSKRPEWFDWRFLRAPAGTPST